MKMRPMLRALFCSASRPSSLVPAASAHVTINPREWEAGGFARFALRVPNETPDAASTTKIVVQFPENVVSASFQPVPGLDAHRHRWPSSTSRSPRKRASRSPSGSTR